MTVLLGFIFVGEEARKFLLQMEIYFVIKEFKIYHYDEELLN